MTLCNYLWAVCVAPRQFVHSHSATHHQNNSGPVRKKTFITFDTQLSTSRRIAHLRLSFNVEKKQRDFKSKGKAKNQKQWTEETRFPQHDEFLFSSPSGVPEKSGYCNAVTVARVLPLVHASAENGKDPLHERRDGCINAISFATMYQ